MLELPEVSIIWSLACVELPVLKVMTHYFVHLDIN